MILLFVAAATAMSLYELVLIAEATNLCNTPVDQLGLDKANQCHALFCQDMLSDWHEVVNKTFVAELCPRLTDNWRFDGTRLLKSNVPPETLRRWRHWVGTEKSQHPLTPRADIFVPEALNREQTARWTTYVDAANRQPKNLMPITDKILTGIEYRAKLRAEEAAAAAAGRPTKKGGWINKAAEYLFAVNTTGAGQQIDDIACNAWDENVALQLTVCMRRAHSRLIQGAFPLLRAICHEIYYAAESLRQHESEEAMLHAVSMQDMRTYFIYRGPFKLFGALCRLAFNTQAALAISFARLGDARFSHTHAAVDFEKHIVAEFGEISEGAVEWADEFWEFVGELCCAIFTVARNLFWFSVIFWFTIASTIGHVVWFIVWGFVKLTFWVLFELARAFVLMLVYVLLGMLVGAVFKSSYVTYLVALAMSADAWDFVPTCLRRFIKRTPLAHGVGRCKCIVCVPDARVDDDSVPPQDEPMPPKAEPQTAASAPAQSAPVAVGSPTDVKYPSKSRVMSETASPTAELDASLYVTRREQLCRTMHEANITFMRATAEYEALEASAKK
jgi:hypothetical protein